MYYLKAQKINIITIAFLSVLMGLLWLFPKDEMTTLFIIHLLFIINLVINIILYFINRRYVKKNLKIPRFLRIITIIILVISIIPLLVRVDLLVELYIDAFKKK